LRGDLSVRLLKKTKKYKNIAAEIKRMTVKPAASICFSPNAILHNIEFPANAISAINVRTLDFNIQAFFSYPNRIRQLMYQVYFVVL
jgi:hypothetical protein